MPLLSSISHQICKPSSDFQFLLLDLLRPQGKKGLSPAKLVVLIAGIVFSAAGVWFAIPFLFGVLSYIIRSSAAPRYLFVAVNFIIFAVWKLSENRLIHGEEEKNASIHGEIGTVEYYIEPDSELLCVTAEREQKEKNSDREVIHLRRRDLGSSHAVHLLQKNLVEDCNEIPSIHGENDTLEYYKEPDSELLCVTTDCEQKVKHSDHEVIHLRRRDLKSSHAVNLLQKTSVQNCNEIPSIHVENVSLEFYTETDSKLSGVKENSDHEVLPLHRQDLGSSQLLQKNLVEDRNEIPSIHGENVSLQFYTEPDSTECEKKSPIAAAAAAASSSSSSLSSALMLTNPEMDEEDSLDATWNSIMRKSGRPETAKITGGVPAAKPRGGNALSEMDDEINQRFDEFIKKNYDQIRLRKHGEAIHQPRRIR